MTILESLASLALIVLAAFLVEALTHHWVAELALYGVLAMFGSLSAFFVYGGVVDRLHDWKFRFRRWRATGRQRRGSDTG